MLRTSLQDHPEVVCLTEMFNPDYTENVYDFTPDTPASDILANHIFTPDAMAHPCVGFLLHREGARFGNWPDLWSLLERDTTLAVVSLRRRNLLRRYLSHRLTAMETTGEDPSAPIRLDKDLLIRDFRLQEAKIAEFDEVFRGHPLMTVAYEDLSDRYAETMGRVQSFLNLTPAAVQPSTVKRPTLTLAAAISNYEALKRGFSDTKWSWFFEERR